MKIEFITADCVQYMRTLPESSVDVVVTSPPYNLEMDYSLYKDKKPMEYYLEWTDQWINNVKRILSPQGSFFLNVGGSSTNPWIPHDVAAIARKYFTLQNHIVWVKSISIQDKSYGHFKPRNSYRFINKLHEDIFHFTHDGNTEVDRLAIGVPFVHPSNLSRWEHKRDKRCRGSTWFIPYQTIQNKKERGHHPAPFPVKLPEMCIKLHGVDKCSSVLDPFGGIGTTAHACRLLNLSCVSVDIDGGYTKIAQEAFNHVPLEENPL